MRKIILFIISILCLFCQITNAESPDSALHKITEHRLVIKAAAAKFDVSSLVMAAIIYTERTLNVEWTDAALDVLLAMAGHNSSIGFCQVKLKTAYWSERQFSDSLSTHFPGKKYMGIFQVSRNSNDLITKLSNDSLNILHAAAYMRIIQSRWAKVGFSVDDKPEIFGTLYSTGLFKAAGSERKPHENPKANTLGRKVKANMEIIRGLFKSRPDTGKQEKR